MPPRVVDDHDRVHDHTHDLGTAPEVARLLRPSTGAVLLDGEPIHRLPTRDVAKHLGLLPQSPVTPEGVPVVDLVGRGLGDSVIPRGGAVQLIPQLAPHVGYVSLRPKQYDVMAIVHRRGAVLSPAAQVMIEVATRHIQSIAEPV